MHASTFAAACSRGVLVTGTVHTSPPSGTLAAAPAVGTGMEATPYFSPACWSSTGNCQGPLIIMAALPAMNCSFTPLWAQVTTDCDIDPLFTRLASNCRACTAWGLFRCSGSPPLDQKNGRNVHAPSPSLSADIAKPWCLGVGSL